MIRPCVRHLLSAAAAKKKKVPSSLACNICLWSFAAEPCAQIILLQVTSFKFLVAETSHLCSCVKPAGRQALQRTNFPIASAQTLRCLPVVSVGNLEERYCRLEYNLLLAMYYV